MYAAQKTVDRTEIDAFYFSLCERTFRRPPVPRRGKTSSPISWKKPLEIEDHGPIPIAGVYNQWTWTELGYPKRGEYSNESTKADDIRSAERRRDRTSELISQ